MEKMNFTYELSDKQKKEKAERVALLLKNPYLKDWRKQHAVEDEYIYDHSGRFSDYCDSLAKCDGCAGLPFCRQPMKGVHFELMIDQVLQNQFVPCNFQNEEQRKFKHERQYREMDMLREYLLVNLSSLDLTKESNDYKAVVMRILKLLNEEGSKGLFLWGKPGVGKSYLAAGISNYYAKKGKHVAFVNVPKLISELKMMFHDSSLMDAKLRGIKNADVVVLDDIGGESVTGWSRDDILLPLLDARMEKRKLTIFTSNYNMDEVKEKLAMSGGKKQEPVAAERLLERINALSCEVFVKGCSRRE